MGKKICILVATYKRKSSLVKFLNSIFYLDNPFNFSIKIIISANDNQNYSEIYKLFKQKLEIDIIREKKKGISNARNKYLKAIKKTKYDYFAFFDDDVQVHKKWLVEMMNFVKVFKVDIIGGPQLTKSKSLLNNLLIRNEKHGANIKWVSANNCFVKKKVLESKLIFDERLNLTGGEDQLFFLKLYLRGFKIKWNAKAKVIEEKKQIRESFLWFLKRNFRYGASSIIIYKEAYGLIPGFFISLIKSFFDFSKSIASIFFILFNSKKFFILFFMYLSRFVGVYFGLIGFQVKEYSK